MAPKNKKSRVTRQEDKSEENTASEQVGALIATEAQPERSESMPATEATTTTSDSTKKRYGSARGVSAMYKLVVKKAQGKKTKVRCNALGVPVGQNRHALQSYVGMLARTMIPIDYPNWPNVAAELKEKLWLDIQETFKVAKKLRKGLLRSASIKWRQFKTYLNKKFVKPYIGQKKNLRKPPKQYAFVGKESWKNFVAQRITEDWQTLSQHQRERVSRRKYPHRMSRKGYVGLLEQEEKEGNLEPGEVPDRAIMWRKARKPKNGEVIDPELEEKFEKIDALLEKQSKGEFVPCGSDDVLTKALETPEHSGRVRGVGTLVTPTVFFNLPTGKRCRITKADLLARDRARDAKMEEDRRELEKAKLEMAAELERNRQEMAELLAMIKSSNLSPRFSERASCEAKAGSPSVAKFLEPLMVDEKDCDPVPDPSKKGPRKCELAVDNIENKVAFGLLFDDEDMNKTIHGKPIQPGCARVSVDGPIKGDALIPIPVAGEIETVDQAVGSHVSWPRDLIIITNAPQRPKRKEKEGKNELHKIHSAFKNMKINKNVPSRFRLLYKHATTFMETTGNSIQIPCDAEVFGADKTIFILHENIIALLEFKMIGQAAIASYMSYLHTLACENGNVGLFGFCDPGATFPISIEFEAYLVNRFQEGDPDRLFIMPHNTNYHWILVLIWRGEIYILNPLPRVTTFPELEKPISRAIIDFNIQAGKGNKAPTVKYVSGCPKQPGGTECGYVVMRYMKEIVMDSEMSFLKKWTGKGRKVTCSRAELDEVRFETLSHIESFL